MLLLQGQCHNQHSSSGTGALTSSVWSLVYAVPMSPVYATYRDCVDADNSIRAHTAVVRLCRYCGRFYSHLPRRTTLKIAATAYVFLLLIRFLFDISPTSAALLSQLPSPGPAPLVYGSDGRRPVPQRLLLLLPTCPLLVASCLLAAGTAWQLFSCSLSAFWLPSGPAHLVAHSVTCPLPSLVASDSDGVATVAQATHRVHVQ